MHLLQEDSFREMLVHRAVQDAGKGSLPAAATAALHEAAKGFKEYLAALDNSGPPDFGAGSGRRFHQRATEGFR